MQRRKYLGLISSAPTFLLAGCGSNPSEENIQRESKSTIDNSMPSESKSTIDNSTPSSRFDDPLTIESSSLVEYEKRGEMKLAVRGITRNISEQMLSVARVRAKFLDDSNTIIGEWLSEIDPLLPGEGWLFCVDYNSEQDIPQSEVESADLFLDYQRGSGNFGEADLEVTDSELIQKEEFGEQTKVVQGTIQNNTGKDLDLARVEAHFLNDNDVAVGWFLDEVEPLQAERGWSFEISYSPTCDTPPSEVVDYHLFATTPD